MSDLIFTIDLEEHKRSFYLVIVIKDKNGLKRNFYKSFLIANGSSKQKEGIALLIKEELDFLNVSANSAQVETCVFNKIRIKAERAPVILKHLALSGCLEWGGKKLFYDPFTPVEYYFEATFENEGLKIEPHYRIAGSKRAVEFLFPGDPAWVISASTIYFIKPQIESKWLKQPAGILMGKKKEEFLEEFQEDPPIYPQVVWVGENEAPVSDMNEPLPFLMLKDRHGAFAELFMDYGSKGNIAYHDVRRSSFREIVKEGSWEKDLLETSFIKKGSEYYCPLDKVSKSISFLIELGWKVFDYKNRLVLRQNEEVFECTLQKDILVLKGSLSYENHLLDLTKVVGAFNRQERFIDLGSNQVGLIDFEMEEKLKDLSSFEIIENSLRIKKSHFGLIEDFISSPKVIKDALVIDLSQKMHACVPTKNFLGTLHPYQQEGLNWLSFLQRGSLSGLLADEMGLGKTVQVLAFISQLQTKGPILIVMPTSLLFNWEKEIEKFLPEAKCYIHSGDKRIKDAYLLEKCSIILTSYAYLRLDNFLLKSIHFSCIILDEGQYIKNPQSQVATSACSLRGDFRLVMTGTPIENRFEDLWSLFHFLMPDLLGEKKDFNAKITASSLDDRYLKGIKKKVRPFILRRKKEDVAKDLPPKFLQVVFAEMAPGQRELYEAFLAKTRSGVLKKVELSGIGSNKMEILEAILRLRQICCHPHLVDGETAPESGKLERLLEDLEEIAATGRKVLIFSQFTQMLQIIKKEIEKKNWSYVYLDGSTKDRQGVVQKFQEEENVFIFLMSLKAGGVGLNLTAADYVFLFDPWWNEAVENQAIDRAHRIGRSSSIIAKRYVTALSIEEKIMRLKEHKSKLSKGVLDFEGGVEHLTLKDLYDLLS